MSGERIATYEQFMNILAEAVHTGLCAAPYPYEVDGLTPGANAILALVEMGCSFTTFTTPYHHRVHALVLGAERFVRIDVLDTVWCELPTIEEWVRSWEGDTAAAGVPSEAPME